MSTPDALLNLFLAAYNKHDHDAMAALYSDTATLLEPGREDIQGQTAIRGHWAEMFQAFPDIQANYTGILASETAGMAEGALEGTHSGTYPTPSGARLPPTGKAVALRFMTSITVGNGEIVSHRIYLDGAELIRQLRPS